MTKTVNISALRADSTPYAHHDVIVTLVAGSAGGVVGSNVIVSQTKVPLDADGEGSIVLATNDVEITSPATSFYRFTVEGSSPTITRSVRITDALPSTISWTRSGIEVGDPTIPQRDVSSDYVQVGDQSLTNYLADLEAGGGGSSDAITVPDGTMAFIGAYYPPASDDLTDHLGSIDDAFVGAAQAIVAVGAASIDNDQKGAPNGVAELDGSGLVLSSQLPSYVDDVIVVADYAALPGTGADGKIYVTSDTNLSYRWTGSAYTEISKSLALGTTSSTAYRGDHGKTAYDHTSLTNNPHSVTAAQVGAASNAAVTFKAQVGDWVSEPHDGIYAATQALNRLTYVPWLVPAGFAQTDGIAVEVTTVATSALCRLGIYLPHATTGRPGALVIDGGTVDFSSGGGAAGIRTLTITATNLTPGSLIYVAVVPQGATAAARHINSGEVLRSYGYASSTVADVFRANGASAYYEGSVTGALPVNATPLIANIVGQPLVALRRSA